MMTVLGKEAGEKETRMNGCVDIDATVTVYPSNFDSLLPKVDNPRSLFANNYEVSAVECSVDIIAQ
jgi:hypothetical protein